ncbi:MAG: hypothetical protein Q9182_002656 [Xanthomendoza sp. 2 TL-2023]
MGLNTLYQLLVACLASAYLILAADHAVGFGLSLDYGIASIYSSDGSSVNVAKIEGVPAYRQMMRATALLNDRATTGYTLHDYALDQGTWATQATLGLQSLRNFLPPWLGGDDGCIPPLIQMLKALKTASESYLQSPLPAAEVVVPFPASGTFFDALRSACSSLSIRMPMSEQPPAGIVVARALGLGRECLDEPRKAEEQLILTIDYSQAALTALLVYEECNIFEYRRMLHNTTLGTNSMSNGPKDSRESLLRALRTITELPLGSGNGAELTQINELILTGESAGDQQLEDVLREVLREQAGTLVARAKERCSKIDPVFAASESVAHDCLDRLNSSKNLMGRHV